MNEFLNNRESVSSKKKKGKLEKIIDKCPCVSRNYEELWLSEILLGWLFKSGSERARNFNILDEGGGQDRVEGEVWKLESRCWQYAAKTFV